MYGYQKPVTERLYLHKDENDEIYVDYFLHQHHIDGIRFLYKQFKKKSPGVIINNPLGYGNSIQVALFLGAIRHLLDKPILILCEESEEMNWLEQFQKLIQYYNIGIAAESPFVKKSIFINTMERLEQFSRRDWSVMVVDNDAFINEKTLQTKFKVDFKIWITPVDMKDHLQTFASIFKWLFPKEKLTIEEYKAKPGDIKDTIAKAVLLDAFLQDIVYRTHLLTPFETPYSESEGTPKKVSKNKDATGTKIKRSKRLSDSAGTSNGIQVSRDTDVGASAVKIPKRDIPGGGTGDFSVGNFRNNIVSTKKCDVIDNKNEMDVESFILNEKPIRYDPFKDFIQDYDILSPKSEESRTDLMEEEPTIFNTPEKLSTFINVLDAAMVVTENQKDFIDSDTNSPRSSENSNTNEYAVEGQMTSEFLGDDLINEINEERSKIYNLETYNDINPGEPVNIKVTNKMSDVAMDITENQNDFIYSDTNSDSLMLKLSEDTNASEYAVEQQTTTKYLGGNLINEIKEERSMICNPETSKNENPEESIKKEEPDKIVIESPKKDINFKLMEMDEQISKKFQGSLLDRLF